MRIGGGPADIYFALVMVADAAKAAIQAPVAVAD